MRTQEEMRELIETYRAIGQRYGVDIQVELTGEGPKQKAEGTAVTLNRAKIPREELETYLAYNVRKILLPRLVLRTDRLLLRGYEKSDAEDCFGFLSDRACCYSDGGYEPFAERNAEYDALMRKFAGQPLRKMMVLKDTGKVVGTVNLFEAEDRAVEAYEIGYVVSPAYQRQGYGYEAAAAVCHCLLDELHADMVVAGAIEKNEPSRRMLEKLGFRFEGRRTKAFYHPEDGAIDLLYYVKER